MNTILCCTCTYPNSGSDGDSFSFTDYTPIGAPNNAPLPPPIRLPLAVLLIIDNEKVLSLSAYTSGILLLIFALFIIVEAIERFISPIGEIRYVEAMTVAVVGMVVNLICALVLHEKHGHSDYNRHSAYLHVVADALTSLGAIFGLICAMIWNIVWIDTLVAFICSIVIVRWAKRLLFDTGKILTSKS